MRVYSCTHTRCFHKQSRCSNKFFDSHWSVVEAYASAVNLQLQNNTIIHFSLAFLTDSVIAKGMGKEASSLLQRAHTLDFDLFLLQIYVFTTTDFPTALPLF